MSYSPIITGGVVVEVPKPEYEKLIRESEQIATIKRLAEQSEYVSTSEIFAILNIERKETANEQA